MIKLQIVSDKNKGRNFDMIHSTFFNLLDDSVLSDYEKEHVVAWFFKNAHDVHLVSYASTYFSQTVDTLEDYRKACDGR